MSEIARVPFEVEGRKYTVWMSGKNDGFSIGCDAETGANPLGSAVATAWIHDPAALLSSIDQRSSMSFEGDVYFAYGPDPDDNLPPGVTAVSFKNEETVSEKFFERFVIEFALACLEAGKKIGVEAGEAHRDELVRRRNRLTI